MPAATRTFKTCRKQSIAGVDDGPSPDDAPQQTRGAPQSEITSVLAIPGKNHLLSLMKNYGGGGCVPWLVRGGLGSGRG